MSNLIKYTVARQFSATNSAHDNSAPTFQRNDNSAHANSAPRQFSARLNIHANKIIKTIKFNKSNKIQ